RQVISVSTLEDAEGAVADQSFDLAILDVNLGQGKTSLNLARHLQRIGVSTLFVTGYNGSELPEDLRHIEIVEKPISYDRLKKAIEATVINTELLDS
ncbi:MAG: hybrid sensor histidine kinase/response regulator, partial [Pseudomonadota bacterium]